MFLQNKYPVLVLFITWMMRFAVGGLFIFSGFTKGIDIWGTIYKFKDYFGALGFEVWDGLNVAGVYILCLIEFITGFFLILGCFRHSSPIAALVIMSFMLPLSLWLAVDNPISDCGCFGDAWKISNWATFWKNVFLTAGAIWLAIYNRFAPSIIKPYLQWIAIITVGGYLFAIALIGYIYQPLIDFRPYKIGTALVEMETHSDNEDEEDNLIFVYEKDGKRKEFTIDDELPDEEDGWVYLERYYAPVEPRETHDVVMTAQTLPEKHLRFFTEDGLDDVTEDVIGHGRQLILMIPVLSEVTAAKTWKINSFYDWCQENGIDMLATVGGYPADIRLWKDISLAEYPIYTSDDTSIKEVVRGNPGIVYIEDGIIKWKSSLQSINIDDFLDPEVTSDPMNFARDNTRILVMLTLIFLGIIIILIFISYSLEMVKGLFRKNKAKDDQNDGKPQDSQ